jgi:tRNA G18 (ribose-2'-O)-methylase SpoU
MAWEHVESTVALCQQLKAEGYQLMAIEQAEGSVSLKNFKLQADEKWAIIFGNEVDGVHNDVLALCDACVEIPQFGTKHSFNVSVCTGIILWELLK